MKNFNRSILGFFISLILFIVACNENAGTDTVLGKNDISETQKLTTIIDSSKLIPLDKLYGVKLYRSLDEAFVNPDDVIKIGFYTADLNEVPEVLDTFHYINALGLSWNNLSSLPGSLANMQYLQSIHLTDNQFEVFPEVLLYIPRLKELLLSRNMLEKLPDNIDRMASLTGFDLKENKLEEWSPGIFKMNNLEVLSLENNLLNSVPSEISYLKNLKKLNISFNPIQVLPKELFTMNLQRLTITSCPMSSEYVNFVKKSMPNTKISRLFQFLR